MPRILRVVSMLLVLAAPAFAQQRQYKAAKFTFQNAGDYDPAALQAACGLHPGDTFDADRLAAAAQKLMDTGLFADAQATLDGPIAGINVIFALKPISAGQLLPARFDNFIWEDHATLLAGIQRAVPLFRGSVPETGSLADDVNAALVSLLAAKGFDHAAVVHEIVTPLTADPERHVLYTVTSPSLRAHAIALTGISPDLKPSLDQAISHLTNRTFSEERLRTSLLTPLLDAGYITAQLANIHYSTAPEANYLNVNITADLQPGDVYHVASIRFDGSPLLAAGAFAASAKLHPGDLASRKLLLDTLAPLDRAYHAQGYMNFAAVAAPTLDPAAHTVAYTVTTVPGDQFTLRSVQPTGLGPQQQAAFQSAWTLQPGALYNPDSVIDFIRQNIAQPAFKGYSITFIATADPESHLVDLVLHFVPATVVH